MKPAAAAFLKLLFLLFWLDIKLSTPISLRPLNCNACSYELRPSSDLRTGRNEFFRIRHLVLLQDILEA